MNCENNEYFVGAKFIFYSLHNNPQYKQSINRFNSVPYKYS